MVGKKVQGKPKSYHGHDCQIQMLAAGEVSHTVFMTKQLLRAVPILNLVISQVQQQQVVQDVLSAVDLDQVVITSNNADIEGHSIRSVIVKPESIC